MTRIKKTKEATQGHFDNAPSHTAKSVRDMLEALSWEVLFHAAYSPDLAPSDYSFASMSHALAEQRFGSYEDVKKCSMNGSQQKGKIFISGVEFTNCPKDGKNV